MVEIDDHRPGGVVGEASAKGRKVGDQRNHQERLGFGLLSKDEECGGERNDVSG